MTKSIGFRVKKWDFNKNAILLKTKTDSMMATHPLRPHDNLSKNEGIGILWYLTITADGIEVLYYCSEELFLIPEKNIPDSDLLAMLRESYERSSKEVAIRNLQVGLNAGFPAFEKQPVDLMEIRKVLYM